MKKQILLIFILLISTFAFAQPEEFNNGQNSGKNKLQRINANADKLSEIIKQIAALRSEVDSLKQKVNALAGTSSKGVEFEPPKENSEN